MEKHDREAERTIVVTAKDRALTAQALAQAGGAPPTRTEIDAAVAAEVREEVLFREARRSGKISGSRDELVAAEEAILREAARPRRPSDAILRKWLETHPDRFAANPILSFDQAAFVNRSRATVGAVLIEGGADWRLVADRSDLPPSVDRATRARIADLFGATFAVGVSGLSADRRWQGPIPGRSGWHLVRIRERESGALPPLAAVRDAVEADWREAERRRLADAAYARLRARYTVRFER